jgi:DNA processing protein
MRLVYAKRGIEIIPWTSSGYPVHLKEIPDPPICLFAMGDSSLLTSPKLWIAVVGTRTPTPYGREVAHMFAAGLVRVGCGIISGLALGVDAIAHTAALEEKGATIAVLGSGIDIIYPYANAPLFARIRKEGLLVSEFPPGQGVVKGLFIARNRIVSGLAKGVLVVEGGEHSGALTTGRPSVEQGRDVFAPPVPLTSPLSKAQTILLKHGAKLVTEPGDILEEYGRSRVVPAAAMPPLTEPEETLIACIREGMSMDAIIRMTGFGTAETLALFSLLEMKGVVKKDGSGRYCLR